ncbi:MAG: EamA family transporter, partial [Spirochaetaceae bacterium]|nr:EamA family transporter [Spirochaetaceae bacterium]
TIYLSPCTFGLAIFAIFARSEAFGVPEDGMNGIGILLLVLIGTGAFVAQAFMAKGYKTVPANKGSIVFYWETALTIALGAIFTGEVLNFRFLVGLAFIMAGLWANSTQIGAKVRVAKGH